MYCRSSPMTPSDKPTINTARLRRRKASTRMLSDGVALADSEDSKISDLPLAVERDPLETYSNRSLAGPLAAAGVAVPAEEGQDRQEETTWKRA